MDYKHILKTLISFDTSVVRSTDAVCDYIVSILPEGEAFYFRLKDRNANLIVKNRGLP
jgi:hypothetical protein